MTTKMIEGTLKDLQSQTGRGNRPLVAHDIAGWNATMGSSVGRLCSA